MTELPIVKMGHPVLRKKCSKIPSGRFKDPLFYKFLKDMVITMRQAQGVGLAANQVGVGQQAIVLECRSSARYPGRHDFGLEIYLDPRITRYSKRRSMDWEGCLSIPGYRGLVPRSCEVTFEARDMNGRRLKRTVRGFYARVIQHEVDHLNGLFYIDRMPDLKRWLYLEEFNQRFGVRVRDN